MKFSIRFADQIVGTLVILALAILVFVIFMLGKNQRWFMQDYQYRTYFTSASGVSPNMPVLYKGFTIGNVKRITLTEDDRVEITFTIFEEHIQRVKEGSLVEVEESPIGLGSKFIFHPGLGDEVIPEGNVIPEVNAPEARFYIARGLSDIPKTNDSIGNIINNVNSFLETINISLSGAEGSENYPIGSILKDIEKTLAQVSDPSGAVMQLLDGEGPVYTNLALILDDLSGVVSSLNRTIEFVPEQLPQIVVLIEELNSSLRKVQDVLTAVSNNPLLRGGIPDRIETGPGGANSRNLEF